LDIESVAITERTAQFELVLVANEHSDGSIRCAFTYNTDLFHLETIQRMALHFSRLADSVASRLSSQLCDLPMMADEEINTVYSNDAIYIDLFLRCVQIGNSRLGQFEY